jgi:hypothetical protein
VIDNSSRLQYSAFSYLRLEFRQDAMVLQVFQVLLGWAAGNNPLWDL